MTTYECYKNSLIDTSHNNSYVKIEYPQVKNKNKYKVNEIIKKFAENIAINAYSKEYDNLNLNVSYEVTYNKNGIFSIVFKGLGSIKNMPYHNNLISSINIDVNNLKIISFNDVYHINEEVISIIDTNLHSQFTPEKFGYTINDKDYKTIENSFQSINFNIEQILSDSSKFYFTDKCICIYFNTYHALGDYFIIELEYMKLENYLKK